MSEAWKAKWGEELVVSPKMVVSPALNTAADDIRLSLSTQIAELELTNAQKDERIARLSLSNKRLRDRVKDLIDLLADFGVYIEP